MDHEPKTRRESKKSAKDKAYGKDTCYSAKRIRQMEALQEKNAGGNTKPTPKHK
jgi:hypothetical protein